MAHAIITKTEPLQSRRLATVTPSNSVLTDITNCEVTPERLAGDLNRALTGLPKGPGACSTVDGESSTSSEVFEAKRMALLKRKHFQDLEKEGHIVTRQTLDGIQSTNRLIDIALGVLVAVGIAAHLWKG